MPFGTLMNDTISDIYPIITPIKQSSCFYAKIYYGVLSSKDMPYIYIVGLRKKAVVCTCACFTK